MVLVSSLCSGKLLDPFNLFGLILIWKGVGERQLAGSGLDWTVVRPGGLKETEEGIGGQGLEKRDPANTQWQVDVAVSRAKLGRLDSLVTMQQRKEYLYRDLELLSALKKAGRLHANQDWSSWIENALC